MMNMCIITPRCRGNASCQPNTDAKQNPTPAICLPNDAGCRSMCTNAAHVQSASYDKDIPEQSLSAAADTVMT